MASKTRKSKSRGPNRKSRSSKSRYAGGGDRKKGRLTNKRYDIERKKYMTNMALSKAKVPDNVANNDFFTQKINTGQDINIMGFVDNTSKTGILSQKDVDKGVKNFASKLGSGKGDLFNFNFDKQNKSLNVKGTYRKKKYDYDPSGMVLKSNAWKLDIPDTFKKVSDTKYVAPKKKYEEEETYTKEYRYRGDDRERERDRDTEYGYYTPVEINLDPTGKMLSSVVERGDYRREYEYEKEDERDDEDRDYDYRRKEERDVYTKLKRDYNKGVLKKAQDWGVYTKRDTDEEFGWRDSYDDRYEKRTRDVEKDVFKKLDIDFTDKGFFKRKQKWDDYRRTDDELDRESSFYHEKDKRRGDVYKKEDIVYGDKGLRKSYRSWTPYTRSLEQKEDRYGDEEEYSARIRKDKFIDYDDKGREVSFKKWADYYDYEKETDRGDDETIEKEGAVYLQQKRDYEAPGVIKSQSTWSPYIKSQENKDILEASGRVRSGGVVGGNDAMLYDRDAGELVLYGKTGDKDVYERDTYLSNFDYYTGGEKVASVQSDIFGGVTGRDTDFDFENLDINEQGRVVGDVDYGAGFDETTTRQYGSRVAGVSYYDPSTGRIVFREKF